jgi:anti-anti-sigma regulatory factor
MSSTRAAQPAVFRADGLCAYHYFQVQTNGHAVVVQLHAANEYRNLYATELEQELGHLARTLTGQRVIMDFGNLPHCCTAMIAGLVRLWNRLHESGGELVFCNMTPQCRLAFTMLNLDGTVFAIYASLAEALESFRPPEAAEGAASSP